MDRFFKNIEDGYLISISTGTGQEEITMDEYEQILSVIRNCPTPEAGYDYRLKADLTWELVELPPEDEDPELSDAEALDIILGGEA